MRISSKRKGRKQMITFLFMILLLLIFGKIFGFAIRAAWGVTKIIVVAVLFPLLLAGLALIGLVGLAFPILLIAGVLSLIFCRS